MTIRPKVPLVGRGQVLHELRGALAAVVAGTSACVIVEGPAGIGKSRLLAEAAKEGYQLGMLVATGRATELDRIAPLTTLLVALLGAQPPVLTDGDMAALHRLRNEPGNGFWIVSHLSIHMEKYAASQPLLIALDDFQWADELTVLAVRILVPALRSSPVLWLLASRPPAGRSPNHEVIDWLAGEGGHRLSLEPLSEDDAVELSSQLLGARPGEDVLPLIRRAGGNPFLLEELITAFQRTGRTKMDLAADVLHSVGNRLRYLSRAARQVLDAGAVLGSVFTLSEVAAVVGSQAGEIHGAVAEIVDEGVLIGTGAELEFRHELIRDAIYSQLTESARRALHREAGRV